MKNLKKYPFFFAIIISTLLITMIGYLGKATIYANYRVKLLKTPQLSAVLQGAGDGVYPWNIEEYLAKQDDTQTAFQNLNDDSSYEDSDSASNSDSMYENTEDNNNDSIDKGNEKGQPEVENSNDDFSTEDNNNSSENSNNGKTEDPGHDDKDDEGKTEDLTSEPNSSDQGKTQSGDSHKPGKSNTSDNREQDAKDTEKNPSGTKEVVSWDTEKPVKKPGNGKSDIGGKSKPASFVTVKQSYFDDALFIGDSRTVGLSEYSGWKNPTYYANVGLTIYDIFEQKVAKVSGKKMTIDQALEKKQFGKIYIMLGINEMGTGTADTFLAEYDKVVQKIHKLQPNAIIYIQAIMNVTKEKSDTDPIFNNKNIKERNEHIKTLADNKSIFYIDVNEAITDKTGGIPSKYTFDNIHLKAAYYKIWTKFLLEHGIVND